VLIEEVAMSVSNVSASDSKKQIEKPLTVSIEEACRLIGVGRTTMWQLIKSRRVATVSVGRRRLVIYASLEALCSEGTAS
jgi:excisionase family DNA binding protein